jgi:hypothetical protein
MVPGETEEDRGGHDPAQDEADHEGDQRTHAPMLGPFRSGSAGSRAIHRPEGAVFTWAWGRVHPRTARLGRTRPRLGSTSKRAASNRGDVE